MTTRRRIRRFWISQKSQSLESSEGDGRDVSRVQRCLSQTKLWQSWDVSVRAVCSDSELELELVVILNASILVKPAAIVYIM